MLLSQLLLELRELLLQLLEYLIMTCLLLLHQLLLRIQQSVGLRKRMLTLGKLLLVHVHLPYSQVSSSGAASV